MAQDSNHEKMTASEIDARCSAACTRVATLALALSMFSIAMYGPISSHDNRLDLGRYVLLRDRLSDQLEFLFNGQCWDHLRRSEQIDSVEKKWSIQDLIDYQCNGATSTSPTIETEAKPQTDTEMASVSNEDPVPRPSRPVLNLQILSSLKGVRELGDTLIELADDELIDQARSTSYIFDRSIYRWDVMRRQMLYANMDGAMLTNPELKIHMEDQSNWFQFLTLDDVRSIAKFEAIDSDSVIKYIRETGQLTLYGSGQRFGVRQATWFLQATLAICAIYFWVFYRESRSSPNYPAEGTLFGAFRRTRTSRIIFFILTLMPAAAGTVLAIYSLSLSLVNLVIASFTVAFSFPIIRDAGELVWRDIHRPSNHVPDKPSGN